jgi:hypothetical protein
LCFLSVAWPSAGALWCLGLLAMHTCGHCAIVLLPRTGPCTAKCGLGPDIGTSGMEKTANLWSEFVFFKNLSSSNFFFFSARKGVPWPCARLAHNCCGATFFWAILHRQFLPVKSINPARCISVAGGKLPPIQFLFFTLVSSS